MATRNTSFRFLDFKPDYRDNARPHFAEHSTGDKFNEIEGTVTEGFLVEKTTGAGEKFKRFIIRVQDGGEILSVELTHCEATYSLLSALASRNTDLPVTIKTRKATTDDSTGYARVDVLQMIDTQRLARLPWLVDVTKVTRDPDDRKAAFEEFFNTHFNSSRVVK